MATRRQLPILNQKMAPPAGEGPGLEGEAEDRPPWHWAAIGALLVFVLWLPLAMVGQWAARGLVAVPGGSPAEVEAFLAGASAATRGRVMAAMMGPPLVAFGAACAGGGAIVGRHGGKAGAREAAVGGLSAATVAWGLTTAQSGLGATWALWLPLALLAAGFAYGGGRWGERARPR